MVLRRVLTASSVLFVAACGSPTETVCSGLANPAILLIVVDSVTGVAPAVSPTVVAISGESTISPDIVADNRYSIGFGRSGTFSVTVKTPGYVDWSISGVVVQEDACGITTTVNLTAKLRKA
jgi:hypothetical protein